MGKFFATLLLLLYLQPVLAEPTSQDDREYWSSLAYQISAPVLKSFAAGELATSMPVEVSPQWDGRNSRVAYMEAFGRLMAGISPWLALPADNSNEGAQRKQLLKWALQSYQNAVDPENPDYLLWQGEGQILVDAAFIAQSFLRAPDQLWVPLDDKTKQRYIDRFKALRKVNPPYSNWLLFSATIETFLLSIDEEPDVFRIHMALRKMEEWYVGDGMYSDGPHFVMDYYNSYVIQPMYLDIVDVLLTQQRLIDNAYKEKVQQRAQRYSVLLERLISPEGTFPVFGRSIPYRLAVFQPLAQLALEERLPDSLPYGQVRAALTASMRRMFSVSGNFDKAGFLQLGFAGHQPDSADWYSNTGSLYLTSVVFLPLGLPAGHDFWQAAPLDWTNKKAWSGKAFPKDHSFTH